MNDVISMRSVLPALPEGMKYASREAILFMEEKVMSIAPENWEDAIPTKHHFSAGVYAREIFIPAGHIVVGKIHKFEHLNIISKGHVACLTEFGYEEYKAPQTFISKAGIKRVVFAFEDTIWTGFWPSESTDPDDTEAAILAKSYDELDEFYRLKIERKL